MPFAELLPWSLSPCLTLIVCLDFFTSSSWERKQKNPVVAKTDWSETY